MTIIPELKKIAGLNEKIKRLAKIVGEKIDADAGITAKAQLRWRTICGGWNG